MKPDRRKTLQFLGGAALAGGSVSAAFAQGIEVSRGAFNNTRESLKTYTVPEWFADADSLIRRVQSEIAPGITVLVKGSRINRLERVVQALTGGATGIGTATIAGAGSGAGPMMKAS